MDIFFSIILIIMAILVTYFGYMLAFMGAVFFVLGGLKIVDIRGFAILFKSYDLIAKKVPFYSNVYPFIEVFLGLCFLANILIPVAAIITIIIMTVGSISILMHLLSKKKTSCACLGAKIKVPLTRFTLVEDIIMAIMGTILLIQYFSQ